MKHQNKIIAAIISCCILFNTFAQEGNTELSNYSIVFLKECNVISKQAMTPQQVEAYLALRSEEKKMTAIEMPIQAIEQQLNDYTTEIERLTKLAIQETDESLHINKAYLEQQGLVVSKLNALMSLHQKDFDQLGVQGRNIGEQADKFKKLIEDTFTSQDYDQIRIITPEKKTNYYHCNAVI